MAFSISKGNKLNKKLVINLTEYSTYDVHVRCDDCGVAFITKWCRRTLRLKNGKKDFCQSCKIKGDRNPMFGKDRSELMKYVRSLALPSDMSRNFTPEQRNNISKSLIGRKQKQETIDRRKATQLGKNPFLNKTHTKETRLVLRIKMIDRIEKIHGNISVNYNENACKIFDLINKRFNINGVHALNGGEKKVCGFFLDFYEPNINLAIEYYEKHHYNDKIIVRDKLRQDEIINELNCIFLIVSYKDSIDDILNKVQEIINNKYGIQ